MKIKPRKTIVSANDSNDSNADYAIHTQSEDIIATDRIPPAPPITTRKPSPVFVLTAAKLTRSNELIGTAIATAFSCHLLQKQLDLAVARCLSEDPGATSKEERTVHKSEVTRVSVTHPEGGITILTITETLSLDIERIS